MNTALSLPPENDLDTTMLRVARDIAMDIYPLPTILVNAGISVQDFNTWKEHPRFLEYLRSETEAWKSATNTVERTKLKAAVIMEEFMIEANARLHDKTIALNHRVELGKLVAKIAGMGEPKLLNAGAGTPTFQLKINIGPTRHTQVTVAPTFGKMINHDHSASETITEDVEESKDSEEYSVNMEVGVQEALPVYDDAGDDDYDPFTSPSTLDD